MVNYIYLVVFKILKKAMIVNLTLHDYIYALEFKLPLITVKVSLPIDELGNRCVKC